MQDELGTAVTGFSPGDEHIDGDPVTTGADTDYCGECGLRGGGDATGCTADCESEKGRALLDARIHEDALAEALRPLVARDGYLRVVTTDEAGPDGQDRGNLWALVTSDGTVVISEGDSLPHPPGAAVPYGVVTWESGTASAVPLSHIRPA